MLLLFSPSAVVRRWGGLVRAVLRARRAALSASSRGPFGFGPRLLRLRLAGPAASAPCSRLLRLRPRSSGKVTMFLPLAVRSMHHLSAPRMICPHKVSLRQVYAQFIGQELHHGGRQQLRAGLQPHALQVSPVRPAPAMQRAQANTRTGCQLRFQHCFHTHIAFFSFFSTFALLPCPSSQQMDRQDRGFLCISRAGMHHFSVSCSSRVRVGLEKTLSYLSICPGGAPPCCSS